MTHRYVLLFDNAHYSEKEVHDWLAAKGGPVESWWKRTPNAYLLLSRLTPEEMHNAVARTFQTLTFLLLHITSDTNYAGRLPDAAFTWLDENWRKA